MIRSVTSLPLSASSVELLLKSGFHSVESLEGLKPLDLSRELGCSIETALSILKSLNPAKPTSATAKDFLIRRDQGRPIITFCKALDSLIGGGIPLGQITELVGVPGIGKTQMAMQLSVTAQIPEVFGGNGGEAVYIDTEGSFMVERVAEIADELSRHLSKLVRARGNAAGNVEMLAVAANTTRNRLLEGVHVLRVHDQTELLAAINQLPSFLLTHTRVRLVVIDSIAFPFRQSLQNIGERSRILSGLAQKLNQIAFESNVAIVLTNHVTTRVSSAQSQMVIGTSSDGQIATPTQSAVVPALGDLWSHCVTNRIILHYNGQDQFRSESDTVRYRREERGRHSTLGLVRVAEIVKSPCWPLGNAIFTVCKAGIRDFKAVQRPQSQQPLHEQVTMRGQSGYSDGSLRPTSRPRLE